MDAFKLKEGFILGAVNSSLGTEGKNNRGGWYDWYKKGRIKGNANPNIAADHYNLYEEDFRLMRELGITNCRLGLSWSRIEPVKGVFNNGELKHYVEMLDYMRSLGITPMMTLAENDIPLWFLSEGGFEADNCEEIFVHYIKKIAETFGSEVKEFITFDEPNLYAVNSYFYGAWPPGIRSTKSLVRVLNGIAECHIAAYETLHEICSDAKVGCAVNMRVFEPKDEKSFYQRKCAAKMENYFQTALLKAVALGEAQKPLKKFGKQRGAYCDFWALSYYTRTVVSGLHDGVKEGSAVDDLGQEIYPQGLVECAEKLYKIKEMPIYITSNGVCDNNDSFRIKYICEHLKAVSESTLPIERYYYRNFLDGFEGIKGEGARFGLVKTDFRTQKRSVKRSGSFYSELILSNALTDEMNAKYSSEQFYKNSNGESLDKIDEIFLDMKKALSTEACSGVVTKVSQYVEDPAVYDESQIRAGEKEESESPQTEIPEEQVTVEVLPKDNCGHCSESQAESAVQTGEPKEEVKKTLGNDMSSFSAAAAMAAMGSVLGKDSEEPVSEEQIEAEAESVLAEIAEEMKKEGSEYSNFEALLNDAAAQVEEVTQNNKNEESSENENPEATAQTEESTEKLPLEAPKISEGKESVGSLLDSILKKESVLTEATESYAIYDNEDDSLDAVVEKASEEEKSDGALPQEGNKYPQNGEEILLDDDDYIDMFLN